MEAPLNQVLADKMVRKQQPGPLRKQFSYILRKEEGVVKQTENDAFRQGVENFQIRQFLASYSRLFCSSQSYRIQPCEKTNRSSGTEGHIVLPLHLLLVFWFLWWFEEGGGGRAFVFDVLSQRKGTVISSERSLDLPKRLCRWQRKWKPISVLCLACVQQWHLRTKRSYCFRNPKRLS